MPAKKGNKYAEKWTKEEVLSYLSKVEKESRKKTCRFLLTALVNVDLYKEVWPYWKSKFKDDDEVLLSMRKIENKLESKLYELALDQSINTKVAIFGLKNNYGWKDKKEVEKTSTEKVTVNVIKTYDADSKGDKAKQEADDSI